MKTSTQYERSRVLRDRLKKLFPELASVKDDLGKLLIESQHEPPHGDADGSLPEVQYNQLRGIHDALVKLLVTQLFDSRGVTTSRAQTKAQCWGCRSHRPIVGGLCAQCRARCTCAWEEMTAVGGSENEQRRVRIDPQCPFHEGA